MEGMRRFRAGMLAAALAGAFGVWVQAQDPATQAPPTFRTGINFVRVDVLASDRGGRPVADLTQADFDVTEDDRPQKIESFRLIRLDGGRAPGVDGPPRAIRTDEDEQAEASRDDVRLFGIFLDDYHTRRAASVSARQQLAKFIQTQLGPSDMVGAMYPLQPLSTIRMTRDHDELARALSTFEGRKYDYRPRNAAEQQYADYPAETVEQIRNKVSLDALLAFIVHMGGLKEGRKSLIVISEGYSNTLPPQLRDPVASMPGALNPDRGNPNAGDNSFELTRQVFSDQDLHLDMQEVWSAANKYNVSLYMVDPRGLATSEFEADQPTISMDTDRQVLTTLQETLRLLADQTDGRAIVNRNDLNAGMKQIVQDASAYYLLGYNSTESPTDGKFHEIKVRVKRPGVQIRARQGYWAVTAEDVKRVTTPVVGPSKPVQNALASITQATVSHSAVRTWIGTSRAENGKTRVTFVWEPVAATPGAAAPRGAAPETASRVTLTAIAPDGSPYFRGRVPDTRLVSFDASPGRMQLRLSVEGASSGVIDSDTREITVPDLTGVQPLIGTPALLRARTMREFQQLKADAAAVPAAAREFSRTDRLLIRVPTYGPGGTSPVLSVHLLNRGGEPMSELQAAPGATPGVQEIELPLAMLAPGEYILEIKAGDSPGELVGFRITS